MTGIFNRFSWRATNAPEASSRTDDIWFLDEKVGWAVNSNGSILKTEDGGDTWTEQAHFEGVYLRCVSFADTDTGWVGTTAQNTPADRLFHTRDGGLNWERVTNLPDGAPGRICGLYVVDESTVYASGTNFPNEKAAVVKTIDGGRTWSAIDMSAQAALLVDIYFKNRTEGWVVGGEDVVKHPARAPQRDDVVPTVLHTTNGGSTWTNVAVNLRPQFPRGEWGWKIQALDDATIFVSLENLRDGAILRSDDGGRTWRRLRINDRQRNSNLEGIGFLDREHGWVGGWGDLGFRGGFTSATGDGGNNWDAANEVGRYLNRFRFIGSPPRVAYASGKTVYKYTDEPVRVSALAARADSGTAARDASRRELEGKGSVEIGFDVPEGADRLVVDVWERFGRHVLRLADEKPPAPGGRTLTWRFTDAEGRDCAAGAYVIRITVDDHSETRLAFRRPEAPHADSRSEQDGRQE